MGDQIEKNELGGACSIYMWEMRGAYWVLVGKLKGKRPYGRPKHRWEDNIKMDLQEVGWGSMDWIDLAENSLRWWDFKCGNEPSGSIKCGKFLD